MSSNPPCPSCGAPLHLSYYACGRMIWCGNGKCESVAANEGAEGKTDEEAFQNLKAAIEREEK